MHIIRIILIILILLYKNNATFLRYSNLGNLDNLDNNNFSLNEKNLIKNTKNYAACILKYTLYIQPRQKNATFYEFMEYYWKNDKTPEENISIICDIIDIKLKNI